MRYKGVQSLSREHTHTEITLSKYTKLNTPALDDAERAMLGCLLQSPRLVPVVDARGSTALFFRESHRYIYRAIRALHGDGQTPSTIPVLDWLDARGLLDDCDATSIVPRLSTLVPSVSQWETFLVRLEHRLLTRGLRGAARDIVAELDAGEDPRRVHERLTSRVESLHMTTSPPTQAEISAAVLDHLEAVMRGDETPMYETGVDWLDHLLGGGVTRGYSYYIGGLYKAGKTKFMGYIAAELARQGWHVDWHSVEMSADEMTHRHIARLTGVDESKILRGRLNEREHREVHNAALGMGDWNLRHFRRGRYPVRDIVAESTSRSLTLPPGERYAVFVDYLQGCVHPGLSGHEEIAYISQELNGISKDLDCPIFISYQLAPRTVEGRQRSSDDHVPMPRPSDARGSTQIPMDANLLLVVHRPWWEATADWRNSFTVVERQATRRDASTRLNLHAMLGTSDYRVWDRVAPDPFEAAGLPDDAESAPAF